jgi:hypothetical protein
LLFLGAQSTLNSAVRSKIRSVDELEAIYLGLVEIMEKRVTVIKFRMNYGSGYGGGSFEVDKGADAT